MRVLDIDLDFFLEDICPLAAYGARPVEEGHAPWSEEKVRSYLENNLGLNSREPVPGRVFETHDGALSFWQEQIKAGVLSVPFDAVHVDAHSDLGIGAPGPGLVLNGALCQTPDIRRNIEAHKKLGQMDEANYLLYAVAFRWLKSLTNVRNLHSLPDVPKEIVADAENGMNLHLRPPLPELFERTNGIEPYIPYMQFDDPFQYHSSGNFDFVSVAISPRYSPASADNLIPVLQSYMKYT